VCVRVCVCARVWLCVCVCVCVCARAHELMSTASPKLKQGTTNVTFAHSFEHMQHDVQMLTLMLLRLGILAGVSHS
jgi:hypothetical protein